MKREPITILKILLLFIVVQYTGLMINEHYRTNELPLNIESSEGNDLTFVLTGIIITTIIIYLFTRLKYEKFLKIWFSTAIMISLIVSLNSFLNPIIALIVAITITILRVKNKDLYIHNLTEVFIYGGLVSIFAPLFNPLSMITLLIVISIYDYFSVFISKHMIMLARSQESINLFTGLMVKHNGNLSILGSGDIAFSLLFAVVMRGSYGFVSAYLTIMAVTLSLIVLMLLGKKNKYYPAMPFITTACLISYLIVII